MRIFITVPSAACRRLMSRQRPVARRRPASGLLCLVASGLLWGTGGLTGTLLSRTAGLSAISVAAGRLTVGGRFGHDLRHPRCPVEHGELGVQVEVGERIPHDGLPP